MENREPKFTYIRNEKGFPVACLAYTREGDLFKYAVSVHNPKDKFDREMARKVAGGRLLKTPLKLYLLEGETLKDALYVIMTYLSAEEYGAPARLQKAACQYLAYTDC